MRRLKFDLPDGTRLEAHIEILLFGAFTGRNPETVAVHIAEMAKQGVVAPARTPLFYRAMTCLLTQERKAEATGRDSRPEVEFVLFSSGGEQYVTVGNDQFDLELEARGLGEKSKNTCQKSIASVAWPLSEVLGHWDHLELVLKHKEYVLQSGTLNLVLRPVSFAQHLRGIAPFPDDKTMLFSGTIPFRGQLKADMREFSVILIDPILKRQIRHDFEILGVTVGAFVSFEHSLSD